MKRKDELIAVQSEYIEFLGKILGEHEVFMSNRGINPTEGNVKLGKAFRAKITELTNYIKETG